MKSGLLSIAMTANVSAAWRTPKKIILTLKKQNKMKELKDYAVKKLREDFDNAREAAAAIDCIEKAEQFGLNDLYKEMIEDFIYDEDNKNAWKIYQRERDNDIDRTTEYKEGLL